MRSRFEGSLSIIDVSFNIHSTTAGSYRLTDCLTKINTLMMNHLLEELDRLAD